MLSRTENKLASKIINRFITPEQITVNEEQAKGLND